MNIVNFVCSHASQEYPRIFLDRETIRVREKHYSLVGYMLILHTCISFDGSKFRGGITLDGGGLTYM